MGGTSDKEAIANIAPQSVWEPGSENNFNATLIVKSFGLLKYKRAAKKLSQLQ